MKRERGRRGQNRLHECEDCKARRHIRVVEFNRAARPRCWGCGSIRLVPVVDEPASQDAQPTPPEQEE